VSILLHVALLVAFASLTGLVLLVLFEPGLAYRVVGREDARSTPDFPGLLALLVDSKVQQAGSVQVLTNGEAFYPAELAAIETARMSVHIEAFILHPSAIADRFLAALIDRAKRGVSVRVVIDAIGSFPAPEGYFDALRAAGGRVARYQPIRWYTLKRFNNRTHRELVIVDGEVGFIGGAGIAAHWSEPAALAAPWRDTMVRLTGPVVAGLQSALLENWVEATGEIVAGRDSFPLGRPSDHGVPAVVVTGTPSPARASRARILFQLALASASRSIEICSPYFLPDRGVRREMISAVARGVRVRVIVPGKDNNHPIARLASRRRYGELLRRGIEVFEYERGMIHAKIMVVDGRYAVVGSTNFDSRSFELNDEVNLALFDAEVAARLARDFEQDLLKARRVTLEDWQRRPLTERLLATAGIVLERHV